MRMRIGHKPGVGGAVKVMRNNADDPWDTPNTDYGKFIFNSETTKLGYIVKSFLVDTSISTGAVQYFPAGTNETNCDWSIVNISGGVRVQVYASRIAGRAYPVIMEASTTQVLDTITGVWRIADRYVNPESRSIYFLMPEGDVVYSNTLYLWATHYRMLVSVYDLPASSDAYPTGGTGAADTRNLRISPTEVKIGKGGADIAGGRDELIADSDRIPALLEAAGEVLITSGNSADVMTTTPITDLTYLDFQLWDAAGAGATYPILVLPGQTGGGKYSVTSERQGDRVRFTNTGSRDVYVRYIISKFDSTQSSGGSKVMRRLPGGHIQIKRPGSSDTNPRGGDIILDTRLPYLPIIAEGYLHYTDLNEPSTGADHGDSAKTVTFDAGGLKPFLKFCFVCPGTSGLFRVRMPDSRMLTINGHEQWSLGGVAQVGDSSIKFHLARSHAYNYINQGAGWQRITYSNNPIGIRYYIFGIPA